MRLRKSRRPRFRAAAHHVFHAGSARTIASRRTLGEVAVEAAGFARSTISPIVLWRIRRTFAADSARIEAQGWENRRSRRLRTGLCGKRNQSKTALWNKGLW